MIKKIMLIIIILFFSDISICNAKEVYLDTNKKIEDNKVNITISSKETTIYGILTKVVYDKSNLKFISCSGSNDYEVTFENDYLLIENVRGYTNKEIASCSFEILNQKNSNTKIVFEETSISNGTKNIGLSNIIVGEKNLLDNISENPKTGSQFIKLLFISIFSLALIFIVQKKKKAKISE